MNVESRVDVGHGCSALPLASEAIATAVHVLSTFKLESYLESSFVRYMYSIVLYSRHLQYTAVQAYLIDPHMIRGTADLKYCRIVSEQQAARAPRISEILTGILRPYDV